MGVPAAVLAQMLEIFHNKKLNGTVPPGRSLLTAFGLALSNCVVRGGLHSEQCHSIIN